MVSALPTSFFLTYGPTFISAATTLSLLFAGVVALDFAHGKAEERLPNWEETDTFVRRVIIISSTYILLSTKLFLVVLQHTFFARNLLVKSLASPDTYLPATPPSTDSPFDIGPSRPSKSLRFTCLTIGTRGDVQPYIALCKGLMAEGHTCKIATHIEFRSWVEGHGIGFREVAGDPAELMQLMMGDNFFSVAFWIKAYTVFDNWVPKLLQTAWLACQDTDVLIESPSAWAGFHIAEVLQIPYYRPTLSLIACFGIWRRGISIGGVKSHWDSLQQALVRYNDTSIHFSSATVIPRPPEWQKHIHVNGFWYLDNPDCSTATPWAPSAALLDFLELAKSKRKKIIYIGFGSLIIPDPEEMTRIVTSAVVEAGVFAVIAKGWSSRAMPKAGGKKGAEDELEGQRDDSRESDESIHYVSSIPHDWLFPRISAAVHHGGTGTSGASLRGAQFAIFSLFVDLKFVHVKAGLPTIIVPFFADQFLFAARVTALGIGTAVRHLTVGHLTSAIVAGVSDLGEITRARAVGEAIRREDGVGNAIRAIYRDLEYARSIIPQ
ncbi:hypothetical protein P7C70_g4653, partial [Phenoliferia sp. Uapishka_3]